jgi:hypothetical protein
LHKHLDIDVVLQHSNAYPKHVNESNMIDAGYISALAALAGTFIGGITSIATTWLGQQYRSKEQQQARSKSQRQEIYKQFIEEASRLHLHALEHDSAELTDLAVIYATVSKMRVFASHRVIEAADNAVKAIVATYTQKNKNFRDVVHDINQGFINPLRGFSEACHEELSI